MICPFSYVSKNVSSNLLTYLEETRTAPHKSFPRSPNSNKAACVGLSVRSPHARTWKNQNPPARGSLLQKHHPLRQSCCEIFFYRIQPLWKSHNLEKNHLESRQDTIGKGKCHLAKNQLTAIVISGRFLICPVSLFTDHSGWLIWFLRHPPPFE